MALTKFCNHQGCRRLVELGTRYCTEHEKAAAEREAQRQAEYDQDTRRRRDAQFTAFYHSREWARKRKYIISIYDGIDVYAYYAKHKVIRATAVHHIDELKEAWSMRLADSNLIPMSDSSHRYMDQLYNKDKAAAQEMLREFLKRWHREH